MLTYDHSNETSLSLQYLVLQGSNIYSSLLLTFVLSAFIYYLPIIYGFLVLRLQDVHLQKQRQFLKQKPTRKLEQKNK